MLTASHLLPPSDTWTELLASLALASGWFEIA
jgi:hypothetical protein